MALENRSLSENVRSVMPVIKNILEIYAQVEMENREDQKIWADYALHWAVRRLEAFLPRVKVSRAAAALARKKGIGDISVYKWDDQTRKMNDPKRRLFHYEHIYPVAQLRRELEALNPVTEEGILNVIGKTDVAWITKEESKKLGSHGRKTDAVPHAEKFKALKIEWVK